MHLRETSLVQVAPAVAEVGATVEVRLRYKRLLRLRRVAVLMLLKHMVVVWLLGCPLARGAGC